MKKGVDVQFYKRLSEFFKAKYPQIELASDVEKDLAIADLAASWSYVKTHAAIAKLEQFADFTPGQATAIANAAATNDQIYWILEDEDVKRFLNRIVVDYGASMDPAVLAALRARQGANP